MGIASIISWPAGAAKTESAPYVVDVYSDYCQDKMTDDVNGVRIVVLKFETGVFVNFQNAEGDFNSVLAAPVEIDRKSGDLSFTVSNGDEALSFQGRATSRALTGTISWKSPQKTTEKILLLKAQNYRERVHDCYHNPL